MAAGGWLSPCLAEHFAQRLNAPRVGYVDAKWGDGDRVTPQCRDILVRFGVVVFFVHKDPIIVLTSQINPPLNRRHHNCRMPLLGYLDAFDVIGRSRWYIDIGDEIPGPSLRIQQRMHDPR